MFAPKAVPREKASLIIRSRDVGVPIDGASAHARPNWKPVVLRQLSLSLILMITITLIGLLQYASWRLPHAQHKMPDNLKLLSRDVVWLLDSKAVLSPGATGVTDTGLSIDARSDVLGGSDGSVFSDMSDLEGRDPKSPSSTTTTVVTLTPEMTAYVTSTSQHQILPTSATTTVQVHTSAQVGPHSSGTLGSATAQKSETHTSSIAATAYVDPTSFASSPSATSPTKGTSEKHKSEVSTSAKTAYVDPTSFGSLPIAISFTKGSSEGNQGLTSTSIDTAYVHSTSYQISPSTTPPTRQSTATKIPSTTHVHTSVESEGYSSSTMTVASRTTLDISLDSILSAATSTGMSAPTAYVHPTSDQSPAVVSSPTRRSGSGVAHATGFIHASAQSNINYSYTIVPTSAASTGIMPSSIDLGSVIVSAISSATAYVQSTSFPSPAIVSSSIDRDTLAPSASTPSSWNNLDPLRFQTTSPCGEETDEPCAWTNTRIFLSSYLPVLTAVLYRMLWSDIASALTLIDPFRQLSRKQGAYVETAFFSYYQRRLGILEIPVALFAGRFTLFIGGVASFMTRVLPALASEVIWVDTNYDCGTLRNNDDTNNPCPPRIVVTQPVLQAIQAILLLFAVALLVMMILLFWRRTGLYSDPGSIAGLSKLMHHSDLEYDIDRMRACSLKDDKTARRALRDRQYILGFWHDHMAANAYGIRPLHDLIPVNPSDTFEDRAEAPQVLSDKQDLLRKKGIRAITVTDVLLGFFVLGTMAIILGYYFASGQSGFNDFFNSNTFGPRFIMTISGTIIVTLWKDLEYDLMLLAPFTRLAQRPSSYSSTIAFSPTVTPFVSTWRTLSSKYYFIAFITVLALLGEALNVVIAGIPYATGQVLLQFQVSTYLSLAILGLMCICIILVFWKRATEASLPTKPNTLAAKMRYLAGSDVVKLSSDDEDLRIQRFVLAPTGSNGGIKQLLVKRHLAESL